MISIKDYITQTQAQVLLSACKAGNPGVEEGTSYARGLSQTQGIFEIVASAKVIDIARNILGCDDDDPLGFLSLTALTVHPGKKGMPGHVDYPHFHPSCPDVKPLAAQFVLSLDGTTDGAAPTWILHEKNVIELQPCELLAFPGTLVHGVMPNDSDRSRTNLLWSIGPSWVRPMQVSLWDKTINEASAQELMKREHK